MSRVPIAILASGRGSNFDAILSAVKSGRLAADIVAVVSDRADAPVLEKAKAAGLPAILVEVLEDTASGEQRRAKYDEAVLKQLARFSPHFLVMAGYMRIVTRRLIEAFASPKGYSRIVNIHPSLLPAFAGVNGYQQAFEHGACVAGVTVHLVEEALDSGPICEQESFSITDCHSIAEVEAKGLAIEHRIYPETLSWILPEKFEIQGRRCVRSS